MPCPQVVLAIANRKQVKKKIGSRFREASQVLVTWVWPEENLQFSENFSPRLQIHIFIYKYKYTVHIYTVNQLLHLPISLIKIVSGTLVSHLTHKSGM